MFCLGPAVSFVSPGGTLSYAFLYNGLIIILTFFCFRFAAHDGIIDSLKAILPKALKLQAVNPKILCWFNLLLESIPNIGWIRHLCLTEIPDVEHSKAFSSRPHYNIVVLVFFSRALDIKPHIGQLFEFSECLCPIRVVPVKSWGSKWGCHVWYRIYVCLYLFMLFYTANCISAYIPVLSCIPVVERKAVWYVWLNQCHSRSWYASYGQPLLCTQRYWQVRVTNIDCKLFWCWYAHKLTVRHYCCGGYITCHTMAVHCISWVFGAHINLQFLTNMSLTYALKERHTVCLRIARLWYGHNIKKRHCYSYSRWVL